MIMDRIASFWVSLALPLARRALRHLYILNANISGHPILTKKQFFQDMSVIVKHLPPLSVPRSLPGQHKKSPRLFSGVLQKIIRIVKVQGVEVQTVALDLFLIEEALQLTRKFVWLLYRLDANLHDRTPEFIPDLKNALSITTKLHQLLVLKSER